MLGTCERQSAKPAGRVVSHHSISACGYLYLCMECRKVWRSMCQVRGCNCVHSFHCLHFCLHLLTVLPQLLIIWESELMTAFNAPVVFAPLESGRGCSPHLLLFITAVQAYSSLELEALFSRHVLVLHSNTGARGLGFVVGTGIPPALSACTTHLAALNQKSKPARASHKSTLFCLMLHDSSARNSDSTV